jgi:hypothetical protein
MELASSAFNHEDTKRMENTKRTKPFCTKTLFVTFVAFVAS